ncbi:hypothetical protein [Paenibacillus rhizophilus]|uniref:Uncharacterized protein n=1 Tax=Paenibacillus rhizophilus TaxID=1850366 RepID=A0A3N9NZK2_9BACL|nr:hypothetical protein [Paenibacillus rhizophilus]RQW08849.1 hypothetical protein EH198_20875 [Paenibacillus rhizophilus]
MASIKKIPALRSSVGNTSNRPTLRTNPVSQNPTLNRPPSSSYGPLTRRESVELKDGPHTAKIERASVVSPDNNPQLRIQATFTNGDGESFSDSILVKVEWKRTSPFVELLEVSGCMPELGEDVQLDDLVGQELLLTIKVNTKNGRSYPNLVQTELIPDDFDTDSDDSYPEVTEDEDQYE